MIEIKAKIIKSDITALQTKIKEQIGLDITEIDDESYVKIRNKILSGRLQLIVIDDVPESEKEEEEI